MRHIGFLPLVRSSSPVHYLSRLTMAIGVETHPGTMYVFVAWLFVALVNWKMI
jgi:hypothetical protein